MFSSSGLRRAMLPACLCLCACATLPRHPDEPPSHALEDPSGTTLARVVRAAGGAPNLSGVRLLSSGEEALASLIALADHAERTLDIQYYIIDRDESARELLHHVRLAAERGVRVRLLVDDLNTAGMDRRFMRLGERTNILVRVFNPFPGGRFALWTRFLESAYEIPRINHRMHNKLMIADNALAITGGRNIGDQYFTRDEHTNFIDLDVVAAGGIVPQLSASFDEFWNSRYAYPLSSLAAPVDAEPPGALDERAFAPDALFLTQEIDAGRLRFTWVPATVLADKPAKIALESAPDQTDTVADDITTLMRSAISEVIIISPYFVPGREGMALFKELVGRGVHIRILTNSLASTDSPLVDTGYVRYRVPLLRLGVELSEVRPKLGMRRARFHPFRSSTASLHAKAVVIDQKTVFIGSMNMDARSALTNSELGLVIRSTEIARQVTGLLDDISADGSYRLELEEHSGHIEWRSGEPGSERIWHTDPETTLMQRLALRLLAPFAPEELL